VACVKDRYYEYRILMGTYLKHTQGNVKLDEKYVDLVQDCDERKVLVLAVLNCRVLLP
jgi:hypothetical protein